MIVSVSIKQKLRGVHSFVCSVNQFSIIQVLFEVSMLKIEWVMMFWRFLQASSVLREHRVLMPQNHPIDMNEPSIKCASLHHTCTVLSQNHSLIGHATFYHIEQTQTYRNLGWLHSFMLATLIITIFERVSTNLMFLYIFGEWSGEKWISENFSKTSVFVKIPCLLKRGTKINFRENMSRILNCKRAV